MGYRIAGLGIILGGCVPAPQAVTTGAVPYEDSGRKEAVDTLGKPAADASSIALPAESGTPPGRSAPAVSPEYEIAGQRLQLFYDSATCWIEYRRHKTDARRVTLDLLPPCYFAIWQGRFARHVLDAMSDGVPVGVPPNPVARKYTSLRGATVVVVMGDPVPERYQEEGARHPEGQCTGNLQAIIVRSDSDVELSRKLSPSIHCKNYEPPAPTMWILSHP